MMVMAEQGSQAAPPKRLRIAVCIKQVPKADKLEVDPRTNTLKRVGVPSEINPPDMNALEMALALKDGHDASVVVISMGPPVFDEALEYAIGMGCDRAVLLTDRRLGASDTVPTAYALSETIHKLGRFDLVFCGEETTDSSTGHVGPGIAGHLDIAQITYVSKVTVEGDRIRAVRAVEDGLETWESPMPCIVTVNFGCNRPRQPRLTGYIRAKREGAIIHWNAEDVGLELSKIGLKGSPTIVARVETVQLPERLGKIHRGPAAESAAALVEDLKEAGLV
jgi:electron transfer flavoprotein beta subunit